MAFKREADSADWLSLLQKRRITELIAENIPEDEAILMRNGRFCCIVCSHRPVFDTPQMLAHHRHGKKHALAAEKHIDSQLEVQDLIQKRQHDNYVKGKEMTAASETTRVKNESHHHPLLTAQKYEPTVKKIKIKPGQRRPVLQLDQALGGAQTIASYQRHRMQSARTESVPIKPYKSKRQESVSTPLTTKAHAKQCHGNKSEGTFKIVSDNPTTKSEENAHDDIKSSSIQYVHPQNSRPKAKRKPKRAEFKNPPNEADEQRRKTAELYLQARGAGWKKAPDGSWVRDENVEFDSDEEPPDIP